MITEKEERDRDEEEDWDEYYGPWKNCEECD